MSEKADVKSSRMQKGRKTINYLQKLKDEGTPIVQMCPGPRDQFWTMAAEMADVDICRLTVPGDGSDPEMQIKLAPYWIKCVRNAAKIIHINFYMQTPTYASKEAAVASAASRPLNARLSVSITTDAVGPAALFLPGNTTTVSNPLRRICTPGSFAPVKSSAMIR